MASFCEYMASIGFMIGGALVNALAFSGSNYLFHSISGNKELKRHNLEMEKLSRQRDEFNKQRIRRLDFINDRLMKEHNSQEKFIELDKAMQAYKQASMINNNILMSDLPPITVAEPEIISDNNFNNGLLISLGNTVIATGITYFVMKKYYHNKK